MQHDLFGCLEESRAVRIERFDIPDAELYLLHDWLKPTEAASYHDDLMREIAWEQSEIRVYGKYVKIPRLNAWYGDQGADYQYSGRSFKPLAWTPTLSDLRQRISGETDRTFNSVLANLYRDGRDSVSWHSDNEPELGQKPFIASLSLGDSRPFHIKHRKDKSLGRISIPLTHGSLLIMGGEMQKHWVHCIPKTTRTVGPRINLTFRQIVADQI